MQKPERKNSHKERIFSLPQNKIDFAYQKEHQNRIPKEAKAPLKSVDVPSLLETNKVRTSLEKLDGWQLTDDHKKIYREFILDDFMTAIDMIDRIALIAENEKHHPDIHLTQYRNLRVGLTSHDLGGLTQDDFIVAQKINDLPTQKLRFGQKIVQLKQKPRIRSVLKENDNKTKEMRVRKIFKKIEQRIKKA